MKMRRWGTLVGAALVVVSCTDDVGRGADGTTGVLDPTIGGTGGTGGPSSSTIDPTDLTDSADSTANATTMSDEATAGSDTTGDAPPPVCGNNVLEGAEVCDLTQLSGETCASLGYTAGTLACLLDCSDYNLNGCFICGNDVLDPAEDCEGDVPKGVDCQSLGFDAGTVACGSDCLYDTSACSECGDGVAAGPEVCDGGDLGGDTCMSLGAGGGVLGCQPNCLFDLSACDNPGGSLVAVRTGDAVLVAIDPMTLAMTDIGPLGVGFDFGETAWDQSTGTLWMIDGRPQEALYTVDLTTGAASLVGVHGVEDLFGLAYDTSTGTLFGSGESPSGLFSMNQATGAAAMIGDPGVAADGLLYDAIRDQLVGLQAGGGQMFTIDRATGAVAAVLSNAGNINNCGLAHEPIADLYWAIDWSGNLYTYDPNAGYTRTLQASGLGAHDGIAYVPGFMP
jgi:hypothetical protein